MANMKVKPWQWKKIPIGREAKSTDERSRIGQFEALESRQLLSAFHPLETKFQWAGRGRSGTTEVRFDETGNFLGATGLEAGLHQNGQLGGGTRDPNRILVSFSGSINSRTVSPSDITITGDFDAADPFRITSVRAKKSTLTIFTSGKFSTADGSDLTFRINDIQGSRPNAVLMDPWSITVGITTTQCTSNCGPNTPPRILEINPAANAILGQGPSSVVARFSEDLQSASVNAASFRVVSSGGDNLFGTNDDTTLTPSSVTYDAATDRAQLSFANPLVNGNYQVRLSGSGASPIRDLQGAALDGDGNSIGGDDFGSTFRVNVSQNTPPTVIAINPELNATVGQSPAFIEATFSEDVLALTVTNSANFQLIRSGDGVFGNGNDTFLSPGRIDYFSNPARARFVVNGSLSNDLYMVRLSGSIHDFSGNGLDGDRNGVGGDPFTSTFRVVIDPTPPTVLAVNPGANVVLSQSSPSFVDVRFSEAVRAATVTNPNNFTLIGSGGDGGFNNGNEITITPSSITYDPASNRAFFWINGALANDVYQVRLVGTGGVQDLAGNFLDGDGNAQAGGTFTSNFVVAIPNPNDQTPPRVTSTTPAQGATKTVPVSSIEVVFSEEMDRTTVTDPANFRLVSSGGDQRFTDGNEVAISPSRIDYLSGSHAARFVLANALPNDSYQIRLFGSGSLRDLALNRLDGNSDGFGGDDFDATFLVAVSPLPDQNPGPQNDLVLGGDPPDCSPQPCTPTPDTFGSATPKLDISFISAFADPTSAELQNLYVNIRFNTTPPGGRTIEPPSVNEPNSVFGFIDLDTDQDSMTGLQFDRTPTSGSSMLGVEFFVDVGSEARHPGSVDVLYTGAKIPLTGDMDFDTDDDMIVYRPLTGEFLIGENSAGQLSTVSGPFAFGAAGDVPFLGDWDPDPNGSDGRLPADGDEDFGTFNPATGFFKLDLNGDRLLGEDRDGDGVLDPSEDIDNDAVLDPFEDTNNNGVLDFAEDLDRDGVLDTESFYYSFRTAFGAANPELTDQVVTGDWDGDGDEEIGVYRARTGQFLLDLNGNYNPGDDTAFTFGPAGIAYQDNVVVVGDWNRSGESKVGLFVRGERDANGNGVLDAAEDFNANGLTDAQAGIWFLDVDGDLKQDPNEDRNGNSKIDCGIDNTCGTGDLGDEDLDSDTVLDNDGPFVFGGALDAPLVGSWTTPGRDDIGVRRVNTNQFFLDLNTEDVNGNGRLDCGVDNICGTGDAGDEDRNANGLLDSGDRAIGAGDGPFAFGAVGDTPLVGSFGFDPKTDIGVFRPTMVTGNQVTGDFFLIDSNGNRVFGPFEGPFTVEPQAPVEFLTESFTVKIPLTLLGRDEGVVNFQATVGPFAGFTDEAPNPDPPPAMLAASGFITPLQVTEVNFITATGEDVRFSPPVIPNSLKSTISIPSGGIVPGTAGIQATLVGGDPSLSSLLDPRSVHAGTVLLEGSGGDEVFGNGNEVSITANKIVVGSRNFANDTIFFDLTGVTLNADLYRFTIVGDDPVRDVHGVPLDGEIFDRDFDGRITPLDLPSGNGISQGDFVATFRLDSQPAIISFRLTRPEDQNVDLGNAQPGDSGVLGDGLTNQVRPSFVGVVTDDRLPIIGDDPGDTFGLDPLAADLDLFGASAEFNLSAGLLHLGLRFTTNVDLASSGDPSSVSGFIDIDADQDPTTGATGWIRDLNASRTQDFSDGLTTLGRAGDLPVTGRWIAGVGTRLGIYRVSTGDFFLDLNGDGSFAPTGEGPFASNVPNGIPVVGDFNGDLAEEVGVFAGGMWTIDLNGDRMFDPSFTYGTAADLPVVGNWVNSQGLRFDRVGVFTAGTATLAPNWRLDLNGNRNAADDFPFRFGRVGLTDQVPVVGDWNGDRFTKVGTYNPILSEWRTDTNGNGNLESTEGPFIFGDPRSTPVIADWDGDGDDDIATFNTGGPTNLGFGQWLIDSDGSRTFTTGDGPFRFGLGREDSNLNGVLDQGEDTNSNGIADPPDLPVAGKWEVAGVPAIEDTFGVFRVKDAGHLTAFGTQGRMDLGVEYFVDLGSEANGRVDLVDARTNGVLMQVEVRRFPDTRTIVVDVPLALVSEAPGGMVTFGGIVGAATEFSDQVPEVPRSAVSAPSLQLELSTGQIFCRNDGNFDDGTTFTRGFGTYTFPVAGTIPDALLESTDTCLNKVLVRATDSFDAAHGVLSRVVLERNVSVDLTPPRIYHIVPPDNSAGRDAPRTIRLHFSEDINRNGILDGGEDLNGNGVLNADDLDPATAERASSYRLLAANGQDQTDKIRLIEYNNVDDTVLITLGSGLPSGFYTFEVRGDVDGMTDVAGNLLDGEPNPGARPLQVGQFPTGNDTAGGDFSTTLLLNLGPPRVLSIDAGAPGTVIRTIYDLRNEDINGNGTLDLHEDLNEDGRFNDGIANPLLNEIADGIDYNDDGFLANDLMDEDLNGDGRFNNGNISPPLDEVADGIDYNRNGVFESSVSEDLNGDNLLNNGILHPLLNEVAAGLDFNGDGLVRNFLINEDFNRNGQFDREEDLNQDSIFNDGSDTAHPLLNETSDGVDYNRDGDILDMVSEDLNSNTQFDRAEVDFNRNRRLDVGDGPAAPRVIVVTIDSPIDPASVPRDLNRNGRLDCGTDLMCGTGDSQDTTGDGVFGPGDNLDEDTRTVFLTRTRTSDQVSGLISSFGDGEFDPFADRVLGYVDLSTDARVLTFVPNPEFLRQDDNGSPLGLAPDHYRFTLIGGGELSAPPTGTQENIIVSCDDFRDELGNPVVELLPGTTAISCRQDNRDDDPSTPGIQSDDRPGYQGTTSIDLFVNLADPTGTSNALVMAAEDRGQLFNPLDDEIAVYLSQDSGVSWTKQPFFAGPESRTVTRPGGDVTFDVAVKPSVTFDSYGQSTRDEDLNNNNVFNDGSSLAQPLLDEAADGVDYNRDGDTADMVSEDRNSNGTFDRSRSTAYVSYLLLDMFNVPDFDVTDAQFGTSWRPDALDAAGQPCDLNRIATDPLCASIVDINDVVGTFDPANYFFEIGFSEIVTPPSANLRRPLFGRIELDSRKDGFTGGLDDFFIDLDQERLNTTVQSRFVALCRAGSTCDPNAISLIDRPISTQIPIEYLGNRVRLRVSRSLIDTDQDEFANMRAVVTVGVNGPDSDSAPDATLGAAPVFDRAFRSSAVVVSRATNVVNAPSGQAWTDSSTDTVVVSFHYTEDQNANNVLDPSEDINANGRLDPSNLVDEAPWITADKVTTLPDASRTANSNLGFVYVASVEASVEPSNGMLADRSVFVVRGSDVFLPGSYDPTSKTPGEPIPSLSYSFNPRTRVDDSPGAGVDARRTNPRVATGPFGELFVLWDDFATAGTSFIQFDRSFDSFQANIVSGHCNSSTIVDSPLNPPILTPQQLCLPTIINGPGGGPPPATAPMSNIIFRGSNWAGADISVAETPVNGFQDPASTDFVSDIDRRTLNPSPAAAVARLSLCDGRAFPDLVLAEPALESCYSIAAQPNHGISASPSIAVDNSVDPATNKPGAFNGRIYVAYVGRGNPNDPTGHDDTDIFVTFSDDSGLNWSTYQMAFPAGVPQLVPPGAKVNDDLDRASQFNPSISVDPFSGNVYVAWYDTRRDEPDFVRASPGNQEAELFFAVGRPEVAGIAFLQNQDVSTRPSDQSLRNAARSQFGFGDYTGIVGSHGIAYPAWTDTRSLLAEVQVSPQVEQPIAEVATARIDVRPAFQRPRQTQAITDVFTEDVNGNKLLDGNEDVNCDGILGLTEDDNGNGILDPNEDRNANGRLDLGEDIDGDGRLDFGEDINQNCVLDQGNPLDGEAINVSETMVGLPSGDGRAGGNFVAGFVVADRFIFADSSYEEDPLQPSDGSAIRPFATLRGAIGLANSIQVTVAFGGPVALPSDGLTSHPKVQGLIDLDVDRDASTPVVDFNGDGISDSNFFLSRVNALGLGPSGLGVEFYIDLGSEARHPGVADLIDAKTRRTVGFVPVALKGTDLSVPDTLVVTIPRTSIQVGDLVPDLINLAVVVGADANGNRMIEAAEVSDLAPNQFTDSALDHFATRDAVDALGLLDIRTVLIDAVPADPVVVRVRDGRTPGGQSIPYVVQPVPGGQNGSITVGQFTDVEFEPGVVVKLRASNLDVAGKGSNVFARGVRQNPIIFTSLFNDDLTVGGDTNGDGNNTQPRAGNWGGLVFRTGIDDALSVVNFARLEFGGGVVPRAGVGGLDTDIRPEAITMKAARPAVVNSAIAQSGISDSGFIENAQAAMSATPDSFLDDSVLPIDGTAAGQRGPLLWNIEFLNNSINGLQVAASHDTGEAAFSTFTKARWDDPVVYAMTSLVRITPGAELVIDPGTVARAGTTLIKSRLGALEIKPGGSLIVGSVGTDDSEIIFTSLLDDIGDDTNNDGPASSPQPGDWGSIFTQAPPSRLNLAVAGPGLEQRVLSTGPTVVFDEVRIRFGGGIYVDNREPTLGSGVLVAQNSGAVLITGSPCLTTMNQCRPRSALQLETPGYYQVSNVLFERNGVPDTVNNVVDPPFTVFARVLRPDIPFDLPGTLVDEGVLNENPFIRGNTFSDSEPNELSGMEVVPIHGFFDPDPLGEGSLIGLGPDAAHLLNVEFADMDGDGRLDLTDGIDGYWDDTDIVHIVRDTIALPGRVEVPNVANFGVFSVSNSQEFRDRVLKIGRVDRTDWREVDFETDPFGAPLTHNQIITSDLFNTGPFNLSIFPLGGAPQIQGSPLLGPPGLGEDQGLWHRQITATGGCIDLPTREATLVPTSGNNVLGGAGVDGPADGFRIAFNQPVYAFGFNVVGNDFTSGAETIQVSVRDPNGIVAAVPPQPLGNTGFRGFISAFPIVEVRITEAVNPEVCGLFGWDDAGYDDFVFSTVPVYPFVPTPTLPSAVLTLASQPAGTVLKSPFNKPLETLSDAEPLIVKLIGNAPAGPDIFSADAFGDHTTQNRAFVGGGFQIGMDDGMDDNNELVNGGVQDFCVLHPPHAGCQSHGNSDWGLGSSFRILGVSANEATGQSRVPVVLTSLRDDLEGPKGLPHNTDVVDDLLPSLPGPLTGVAGAPVSGDWGDIFIGARSAGDRDDLRVRDLLGRLVEDAQAIPGRAVTPENPLLPPELDESQGSVILDARIKYGAKIRVQGASLISNNINPDAFGQQAFNGTVTLPAGALTPDICVTGGGCEAKNGSMVIAHNELFNMRDAGVVAHPGYYRVADAIHDDFLWVPAEPWVYNNVIAYVQALDGVTRSGNVGGYGVRIASADVGEPVHPLEYFVSLNDGGTSGVIMHNTVFGTLRGVQIGPGGASLAINNLISDVTNGGLIMDPGDRGGRWQAGFNLFFNVSGLRQGLNNIDGNASYNGTLFVDENIGDFRLRPFSATGQPNPAIDSALGEYAPASHWSAAIDDSIVRLPLPVTVFNTSPLGPEKDLFGSVRQDDVRVPNRPPLVGVGAEVWFDIGAVESRDFGAPVVRDAVAELTTRNVTLVPRTFQTPQIGEIPTRFVITVSEDLDRGTLTKRSIELVPAGKDGQFQGTEIPVDILIDFDPATNALIVTPSVRLDEDLFKLTLRGTGNAITDLDGIRLDGEFPGRQTPCAGAIPTPPCTVAATGYDSGEGIPGGDFVTFFRIGIPPQVDSIKVTDGRSPQQPTPMLGPPRGADANFFPDELQFRIENPPTEIEVQFTKPVIIPNQNAFRVVAYGADGQFGTPDDQPVNGTISPATGTASDTWVFRPAVQGTLPTNSIWRIELDGTSAQVGVCPIQDAIADVGCIVLDGEFFSGDEDTNLNGLLDANEDRNGNGLLDSGVDFLPSGDLVSGGDFIGYFQVGDIRPPSTSAIFVDVSFIASKGVCPVDTNTGLPIEVGLEACPFNTIKEGLDETLKPDRPKKVIVLPGVYREPVELIGGGYTDVTLISSEGDLQTTIDAEPGMLGADGRPIQAAVTLRGVGGVTVSGFQIISNGLTGVIVDIAALGRNIKTNLITSNTIFGNEIGVLGRLGKGKGFRLENNVIWANTVSAVQVLGAFGDATADIVNNTIVFNQEGVRLSNIGIGVPLVANIFNNIIVGSNGAGIVSTRTGSARIDFNDVFQNLGGNYLNVGVSGTHNIAVDPRFVRPVRPIPGRRLIVSEADWHLLPFSPAIDAGLGTEDKDPDGTGPLSPDGQLNCGRDGICGTGDTGDEDILIRNDELDFSPLLDHDGNPRFDDTNVLNTGLGTPNFVDIGALERQAISTGTPGGPVGAVTAVRAMDQVLADNDYLQIPIEPEQLPSRSRDKVDWMDELDRLLESGALKKSGLFRNRYWQTR